MLRKRTLFKIGSSADANTIMLLHLDNNLVDSGIYASTLSSSGTSFSTTNKKFGTHCITNDGNGAGVNLLDNFLSNYMSSDFTIDYWVRPPASFGFGGDMSVDLQIGAYSDPYGYSPYFTAYWYYDSNSKYNFIVEIRHYTWAYGGIVSYLFATAPTTPIHVAITRSGNSLSLYINGVLTDNAGITESLTPANQSKSYLLPYGRSFIDEFRFSDTVR